MAILGVIIFCLFGILANARPTRGPLGSCHFFKDYKHCIYVFDIDNFENLLSFCESNGAKVPGPEHVIAVRKQLHWLNVPTAYFYTFKDGKYIQECNANCNSAQNYPDQDFKGVCIGPRKPKLYCKPQFTLNEEFRACYHQAEEKLRDFYECRDYCREQGANPIVFDTYEQWQWVIQNFLKPASKTYGMGGSLEHGYWSGHLIPNKFNGVGDKEFMRNNMYTIDGSVIKRDDRFWQDGEPNAGGNNYRAEHCIEFWITGERFNDYFCDQKIWGCACRAVPDQTTLSIN